MPSHVTIATKMDNNYDYVAGPPPCGDDPQCITSPHAKPTPPASSRTAKPSSDFVAAPPEKSSALRTPLVLVGLMLVSWMLYMYVSKQYNTYRRQRENRYVQVVLRLRTRLKLYLVTATDAAGLAFPTRTIGHSI